MAKTYIIDAEILTMASIALKKLALDEGYRAAFITTSLFRKVLEPGAQRYLISTDRHGLWPKLHILQEKGYQIGIEYVDEEVSDPTEVEKNVCEYLQIIDESNNVFAPPQLGFDLSAIGLRISPELALRNTARVLQAASTKGIHIVLSMERSSMVDAIFAIYHSLAKDHSNLGITLQAQLKRSPSDIEGLLKSGGKIRLVKGVYQESSDVALPRGDALDRRYCELLQQLTAAGACVSCATHDEALLSRLQACKTLSRVAEVEMLHGVQPSVLKPLRQAGVTCRISTVYGQNWYLHFLHRLAESPENVLQALADFTQPQRIRFAVDY